MIIKSKNFLIKRVDESNIDLILQVYKQCEDFLSLGPVPYASRQMVLDDLDLSREEGGVFCGIFVEDEIIGVVDFVPGNYEGKPEEAYLALLMIAGPHRQKGIGREVVDAVEAEMLKNGSIKSIRAGVQTNNPPAIAFWQAVGYRIVSGPTLLPDTTTAFGLKKDVR